MSNSSFRAGTKILINAKEFELKQKISSEIWQVQECKTHILKEYAVTELQSLYVNGELAFEDGLVSTKELGPKKAISAYEFSETEWELLKVKRAYVVAVINLPNTEPAMRDVVLRVWEKLKKPEVAPNWNSVYRWKKRYIAAGSDIRALGVKQKNRGNRKARHPDEIVAFIEKAIDQFYMTREQKTVQDVVDLVQAQITRENHLRPEAMQLTLPRQRLVRRMIKEIPAIERCIAREGRDKALNKFRNSTAHRLTQSPLERAEIDHTILDLMLTDESGFPIGRPRVTVCIDDYSRCILGLVVGFEPPNFHTVAQCLKVAFLPKTQLKKDYPEIVNNWDSHGIMRELVVDNGMEFHSDSLENACYSLGVEIHYSARKTAWFKGKIERFIGTFNSELAHGNPGTTFSNILDKGDYDPVKHAVIRYSVFLKIMNKWIVDVYHQRVHRTLGATPASVWASSIATSDILLPNNIAQLDALLGRTESRVLTHKGIELNGLLYNSSELNELRKKLGVKLQVDLRVDDSNLGSVIVLSPDKTQIFKVPALLSQYAEGLSSYQHRTCKKYAQTQLGKNDDQAYLEAKLAIVEIIAQESNSGRKKMRQKVARYKSDDELSGSNNRDTIDIEAINVTRRNEGLNWHPSPESVNLNSTEGDDESDRGSSEGYQPIIQNRDPRLITDENI